MPKSWKNKQYIKWAEQRLLEANTRVADTARDLRIWLARERDGKSWGQIATREFHKAAEAQKSKARRAYERVENFINRRGSSFQGSSLLPPIPSAADEFLHNYRTRSRLTKKKT